MPSPSAKPPNGTRKTAPAEARSAFGPVGSAQPAERRTKAGPSASAARRSVPTFPGSETRQSASPTGSQVPRQVGAAEDGDDPCRVRKRRETSHHVGRDELGARKPLDQGRAIGVDQRLHRLEAGVEPSRDEVLALAGEETELVPLAPRPELANELEARVRGRCDQASFKPRARPSPARRFS